VREETDQLYPVPSSDGDARRRWRHDTIIAISGHLDGHEEKPHGQRNVLSCVCRFPGLEHVKRVLRCE